MRVRNVVGLIALCVPGASLAAQGASSSDSDMSLGLRLGSLGIGLEFSRLLGDNFGFRLGGNYFSLNQTSAKQGITYDATLKLQAFTGLLDWYPASRGKFHFTAGVITNPLTFSGIGQPSGSGNITVNNTQYTQSQVGSLTASIKYPSASPYVGLGFGTPTSKTGGFGVVFDIGAAIGKPKVALSSTNAGNTPGLQANIDAQTATTQKDANKIPVWPVISLGFVWKF
jgi:hypothetical protein